MDFYRLFLLIAMLFQESSAIEFKTLELTPKDSEVMKNLLLSKYPTLSEYISMPMRLHEISFLIPQALFSRSSTNLVIPKAAPELIFQYISLDSEDFSLKSSPKLLYKYACDVELELYFTPLSSGTRVSYLFICTNTELIGYILKGTSEDSVYNLNIIQIEYLQGTYGVATVYVSNPFGYSISLYVTMSVNKNMSYEKLNSVIPAYNRLEVCIIRAYFNAIGDYKFILEVIIDSVKYYLPAYIKVRSPGIEAPKTLNFGIIVKADTSYFAELYVKNTLKKSVKIIGLSTLSKEISVTQESKLIPSYSDKYKVATVKLSIKNEGFFSGFIELHTPDNVYKIECTASVLYSLIDVSGTITFNPGVLTTQVLKLTNNLNHDIYIGKYNKSTFLHLPVPSKLQSKTETALKLSINTKQSSLQYIQLPTSLGSIHIPVHIQDPTLQFLYFSKGKYSEIYGPIDLGYVAYDTPMTLRFSINNPNRFDVLIELIESIQHSKIEMPKRNTIPSMNFIEFSISIKAERSLFNSIIFHTSIGSFFITVCMNVVSGIGKIKPVYFGEVLPSVPKEQFIYFTNNFPVPVKIISISSKVDVFTFESIRDSVQPSKEQIIGKVKIIYSKTDRIHVDWNKYLTHGDARTWNQLNHHWENGEKIGDLTVVTDISGEIDVPVFIGFKKPQLIIDSWPKFDYCSVGEICTGYFKIHNPLPVPMTLQLLVVPDFMFSELRQYDCNKHTPNNENADDEFENINNPEKDIKKIECVLKSNDEISIIKTSTEKKPRVLPSDIKENTWVKTLKRALFEDEKKMCSLKPDWKTPNSIYEAWDQTQSHFIGGKNVVTIPSRSSKVIGPVYFQPITAGQHNLSLMVRNNYTLIEGMSIKANVGYSKLVVMKRNTYHFNGKDYVLHKASVRREMQKLIIDVSSEELSKFIVGNQMILNPVFVRGFELQNSGNVDFEVNRLVFEGNLCELDGYFLKDCGKSFLLRPSESINIEITYTPSTSLAIRSIELWVVSNHGVSSFIIETRIPEDFNLDIFLSRWGEESLIIALATTITLFLMVFKHNNYIVTTHYKSKSSKDLPEISIGRYFSKKYSQPIFFTQKELIPIQPEPVKVETSSVIEINDTVQPIKSKKKVKIRRNLVNTVIQKAEDVKLTKNTQQLPEVIATNKLLIDKKIKRPPSDDPAPKPKEIIKVIDPDEDFYIDSYKTNNILFGGISDRESVSLAELTQDSDPLDNLLD
jgi:hypothetical protein